MLLGTCGISKAVFPAWCPMARKEISQCQQVQPSIEHTVMVSHPKICGQKGCQMHRTVEINACTAMAHAFPPSVGQMGQQECSKQGRGDNPTSNSSWILSGISSPSAPHRKAQWPSQTALELVLQILQTHSSGTEPSSIFGMGVGFCHPPGTSAHMMEPSYNQPPEIFWLDTVFKGDKRGICESTL